MTKSRSRKFADIMGGTFSSMIEDGTIDPSDITGLHTVATSGSFDDLSDKPAPFDPSTLATVSTTGSFNDLSDKPSPFDPNTLATVATSGSYSDLSGTPTLGTAAATASTDYATSAQGTLADSAVQPNDSPTFGTVNAASFSGDGSSLTGIAAGATGGGNDDIFYENGQNVTTDYTITSGKNAMSAGPITINSGVTVTVGAGQTWTVI